MEKFVFLFFCQTTLRGEPAEIYFSVMKTDERSSQGESTVSVFYAVLSLSIFVLCIHYIYIIYITIFITCSHSNSLC